MSETRNKGGWQIIVGVVLILLVALGTYVGGYFALGTKQETSLGSRPGRSYYRIYPATWQACIFWPAAQIEAFITGDEINAVIESQVLG